MVRFLSLSMIVMITSIAAYTQGDSKKWVKLFDGKTTKGWHSFGKNSAGKAWVIEDQCLKLQPKDKNGYQVQGGGDLVTDEEYQNFELKLEWKISKGGNSGIIFYVVEDTSKFKETWMSGIETQVLDITSNEDANVPKLDVADIYDLIPASSHPAKPYGEWNKVYLKSLNGQLEISLNDVPVISTKLWDENWKKLIAGSKFKDMPGFGTFKKGKIALQDHGNEVYYRNIEIRKL